ncbi:MAG: pilus assembly protein PilM [Candidatus Omnitrophica bacterium]|nr:pilus assembly protein PilM [Candidatus Omnitrophota bacterium]
MNALGIYFGPQLVGVVETKGTKTINYTVVSHAALSVDEVLEEKVPGTVKLITLLKDELVKNNINADEATISISGKDLIVRTFEMPIMSRQELNTAVNFEVKKYIPFKIEDLVSDFQYKLDNSIRKTRVLFVGIKKEALDNYIDILTQLNIKITSIEYSAFSILRLLKVANIKDKGVMAVVNIDLAKDDEANFVVLDDGFPLFSRDISLMGGYEEPVKTDENQAGVILDKLKREIQISLDYYDRKFPGKNISRIFFITNPNYRADLDGFIKELGIGVNFIEINKYIDRPVPFSLAFVKGYSSSLAGFKIAVKIDLLAAKERTSRKTGPEIFTPMSLVKNFKYALVVAGVCLFILGSTFISGISRALPLQRELRNIINTRQGVATVSADLSSKELQDINTNYKAKANTMDNIIKKRIYFTPLLDAIPRVVSKGMRLEGLSLRKGESGFEFILNGSVFLANSDKETEAVNTLVSRLKENPAIAKYFKDISVGSIDRKQIDKMSITSFMVSGQYYDNKDKPVK